MRLELPDTHGEVLFCAATIIGTHESLYALPFNRLGPNSREVNDLKEKLTTLVQTSASTWEKGNHTGKIRRRKQPHLPQARPQTIKDLAARFRSPRLVRTFQPLGARKAPHTVDALRCCDCSDLLGQGLHLNLEPCHVFYEGDFAFQGVKPSAHLVAEG